MVKKQKFEPMNLNKDYRLAVIMDLALEIQNPKKKSIKELRELANNIEVLANTKLLKELNQGIKDIDEGRYKTFDEMMESIRKKPSQKTGGKGK